MEFNELQSSEEELQLSSLPEEIQEQFWDCINNIPYINSLVAKDRPRAKDLPRDEKGRIIVDLAKPHILEDMDYFRQTAIYFQEHGQFTNLTYSADPHSAFYKWAMQEIDRIYDGMVRESDGEWIPGNMYFFLNYCPMEVTKTKKGSKKAVKVVDFPNTWEGIYYRFHYIDQAINGGLYSPPEHYGGQNGCEISSRGKAHPYSQVVYTPTGRKMWQDIQIGDYLFGDDGKLTKVINIPFDGYEDIYKITLKDKRVVYASGNHLWNVWRNYSHCYKTLSTLDMMKDFKRSRTISDRNPNGIEYNYKIPNHKGVDFQEQSILIDAYTLGICLGDGSFRQSQMRNYIPFTSHDNDINSYKSIVPYNIKKVAGKYAYYIEIPNVKDKLIEYNLFMKKSEDKFIPDCYKFNTRQVRINILRGLMDTDGSVDNNGIPIIGTSSKRLANDIMFIARSLGYNCLSSIKKAGYKKGTKYIECLDSYIVRIYTNERLFNLERKQSKVTKFESNYSKHNRDFSTIVNIEYDHKEKCKCVTVDNKSECYLIGDFIITHNSKSMCMAAIMTKYFKVGETKEANEHIKCVATASDKTYLTSDGLLNKFDKFSNFLNQYGFFPKMTTKASLNDMHWISGYKEVDGTIKGTQNEVIGVSSGENDDKIRGKRMQFFIVEEFGNFKNILDVWEVVQPCVQDGDLSFGCAYFIGTSNNKESDFLGAQQIVFNPKGYNMYAIPNVFDKEGQGKKIITFFFPAYINREGCYDHNGNSDVTKALIQILTYRWEKRHNTTDLNAVTKAISEYPITPQEALLRARNNLFPVADLNNRVNQIDANPDITNSIMVGTLTMDNSGKPKFEPTNDIPIRDFPLKDNKAEGALEIYEMPNTMIDETSGVEIVPNDRYIIGFDNYENDVSNTLSLGSLLVLDLWTDRIVAEYTGRPARVDDLNEMARRMCLFYNAKVMYENNKKNTFAYFQKMNCIYLLADTPSFINRPQDMSSKFTGINNTMKGINCTTPIINLGLTLIKEWLTLPVKIIETVDGEQVENTVFNLYTIKNRALLRELICFNPEINVDRIRSLTQLLIYRAEKRVLLGDDIQSRAHKPKQKQDDYFDKAYSKYQKNRIKFR